MVMLLALVIFSVVAAGSTHSNHHVGTRGQQSRKQLTVYWGQDSAGSLRLTLEKGIDYYCKKYDYDIIPVAFLNVFFDTANKDKFPGINLANHCNATFKDYPTLLNCTDIGKQIQTCQRLGKRVILSLGGAAGLYYFSTSSQAVQFAQTVWSLFLDGSSKIRPFHNAILDGVDLDIEGGNTKYYSDFVLTIRRLMNTDTTRSYLITGAPQCPYPDAIMGPGSSSMVLTSVAQEFDYLFVQFYNNYCSIDQAKYFNSTITSWFKFSESTRQKYGKGPKVFIGLPASPRVHGYQPPNVVDKAWKTVKDNVNLAGIMLWDASFDMNNFINGNKPYSTIMRSIMDGTYDDNNTPPTTPLQPPSNEDHYNVVFVVRIVGTEHNIRIRYIHLALFCMLVMMFVFSLATYARGARNLRLASTTVAGNNRMTKQQKGKEYVALNF